MHYRNLSVTLKCSEEPFASEEFHPWPPVSPFPTEQQNSGGSTSVSSRPQFFLSTAHALPSPLLSQDLPGKPRAPQVTEGEDLSLPSFLHAKIIPFKNPDSETQQCGQENCSCPVTLLFIWSSRSSHLHGMCFIFPKKKQLPAITQS